MGKRYCEVPRHGWLKTPWLQLKPECQKVGTDCGSVGKKLTVFFLISKTLLL
jgi:hypothetical protein